MKHHAGRVEVICGCMFSGKTEELIRRVRRAAIARQKVQVFKPKIDIRYAKDDVAAHNGQSFEATPIEHAAEILKLVKPDTTVVALDEAQFFDRAIIGVIEALANRGTRVIVAGLNLDFRDEPFGPMPEIMVRADDILMLHAICMVCGEHATRTQRLVDGKPARYDDPIIWVGAAEAYEARCREHHEVPGRSHT